jgi:Family of unknown function (DUF6778)
MKIKKIFLLIGLGLSVSACATTDITSRNAPYEQLPNTLISVPEGFEPLSPQAILGQTGLPVLAEGLSPVTVNSVTVRVPRSLKVSEANRFLPSGDIVWREDPIGDRYAQVQKIFEDAMTRGVAPLNGPVGVDIEVQVLRFHALTEKARYTVGGVHSITFDLAIRDSETGELVVPVRTVRADLDAFGGKQALAAEARGQTQKVRISDHLAEVIRQELSNPEGYKNASLGFYQMLNNI